ncbi:MAG TPA: type II secretion system protein [Bacillaceae bacterium]|nr:type II secretion system protein [Paenibacillus bovis]HLU22194.1 type II secretion system protein [Bacillaceae bacterium]
MKNEAGYMLIESIFSISMLFIVCASLLPIMITMLSNLRDAEKELTAFRILYEQLELDTESNVMEDRYIRGVHYHFQLEEVNGEWRACVFYEEYEYCTE